MGPSRRGLRYAEDPGLRRTSDAGVAGTKGNCLSAHIETYAMVGNCFTAALVGLDGSVDWLCLPNFGSGACFAALLGTPENGRWQVAPTGPYTATRRYRGDTMILETDVHHGRRRRGPGGRLHAPAGRRRHVVREPGPHRPAGDGDGVAAVGRGAAVRLRPRQAVGAAVRGRRQGRGRAGRGRAADAGAPARGGLPHRRRRDGDRRRRRRDVRADLLRQPPAPAAGAGRAADGGATASGSGRTGPAGTPPTTRTGTRSCGRCWR